MKEAKQTCRQNRHSDKRIIETWVEHHLEAIVFPITVPYGTRYSAEQQRQHWSYPLSRLALSCCTAHSALAYNILRQTDPRSHWSEWQINVFTYNTSIFKVYSMKTKLNENENTKPTQKWSVYSISSCILYVRVFDSVYLSLLLLLLFLVFCLKMLFEIMRMRRLSAVIVISIHDAH